jgi:alkylation response protein AidB-like acyl-CoA dehydrogenase
MNRGDALRTELVGRAREMHAYRAAADIDEAARAGRKLTYTERARVRMDTGWSVKHAREAIRLLINAHGAGSFADSSPMQRFWRDSEVASRHAVISPDISAEVYGRALLGIHEGVTPLV